MILIQARTNSTRLPEKIYKEIAAKPILSYVVDACEGHDVVVIGPEKDEKLYAFCGHMGYKWFGGSEDDLVARYWAAIQHLEADFCVRLTGDCWKMTKNMVSTVMSLAGKVDYVSNTMTRSFMEGLDIQAGSRRAWEWLDKFQHTDREHPWLHFDENKIVRNMFAHEKMTYCEIRNQENPIFIHTSIDTQEDYDKACNQLR